MIYSTLVTVVSKFIDFAQNYICECKFIKILSLKQTPWRNMQCEWDSLRRMPSECYILCYDTGENIGIKMLGRQSVEHDRGSNI